MVPAAVEAHVDAAFGHASAAWHAALSQRLPALIEQWQLRLGDVLPGGWSSIILGCDTAHGRAVLKLTLRPDAVRPEARALRHWGSHAAAGVLACDTSRGALLLERLEPGTPMGGSSVAMAARVLDRLHRRGSPSAGFPSLADAYGGAEDRLLAMWRRHPRATARERVTRAARWLQALSATPVPHGPVLLHGDPVPANFLLGAHGYRAIDPRPRVGDPTYDLAFWALFAEDARDVAGKAEAIAAALGADKRRVQHWVWAIAVDRRLQVAGSAPHEGLAARLDGVIDARP